MYGGRPLGELQIQEMKNSYRNLYSDVRFNDRWHTFTPTAARGGTVAAMQADAA